MGILTEDTKHFLKAIKVLKRLKEDYSYHLSDAAVGHINDLVDELSPLTVEWVKEDISVYPYIEMDPTDATDQMDQMPPVDTAMKPKDMTEPMP